jgi:hypothetical protein
MERLNIQRAGMAYMPWPLKKEFYMTIKNSSAAIVSLVCLWMALSGLTGCSTTRSIVFAAPVPPAGEYKYAVFPAASFGMEAETVLQRFYKQYPADQYEVIACEAQSKDYLSLLGALGGGLLGALVAVPIAFDSDNTYTGIGIAVGGIGATLSIGNLLGEYFKTKYVITYIERKPAPGK